MCMWVCGGVCGVGVFVWLFVFSIMFLGVVLCVGVRWGCVGGGGGVGMCVWGCVGMWGWVCVCALNLKYNDLLKFLQLKDNTRLTATSLYTLHMTSLKCLVNCRSPSRSWMHWQLQVHHWACWYSSEFFIRSSCSSPDLHSIFISVTEA